MRFLSYAVFAALSICRAFAEDAVSLDGALLSSQAEAIKSAFPSATPYTAPFITPGGNLERPPASVAAAIITGVPASVIAQLAIPSARSSIQSEFKAGKTPAWYQDLPIVVKEYVSNLHSQVAAGAVNLSASPTEVGTVASADRSIGGHTSDSNDNGAAEMTTSTSSGLAPQATAEVAGSIAGALGILGLALVL